MIRPSMLLLALTPLLAAPVAAQGVFEGALTIKVAADRGRESQMNYLMKDGKMRLDQPSGRGGEPIGIIIDPAGHKMQMLMSAQKMYMEMELKQREMTERKTGDRKASVERTGKMERVAGYSCEHVIVTDDDGAATDACVTTELGTFRMPMGGGGPMSPPKEPGWAGALAANSFPLKVSKGDKIIFEVLSVEKKSLDAALFAPPKEFNKFEMPSFKRPQR